jgi:glycosyltransferase involved in cell wall biosynthesis
MKILGLISSISDPASRFRITQYREELRKYAVMLDTKIFSPPKESDPPALLNLVSGTWNRKIWRMRQEKSRNKLLQIENHYDLLWQNRLLLYQSADIETRLKKPRVFDFDDAIWMTEGKDAVDASIRSATKVFAGNEFLAGYASRLNAETEIVPTTIDTTKFCKTNKSQPAFTIGWIGTKSNFPYLEMIRAPLLDFLRTEKDARLMIVSSEAPSNFTFDNQKIVFVPWSATRENDQLNEFSVGLMPLDDNEWTRGKCSAKLLQYLACEIPAVVSPVGNNKKILAGADVALASSTNEEWINALKQLKHEPEYRMQLGKNGRMLVENNYSVNVWGKSIYNHFKKLVQ